MSTVNDDDRPAPSSKLASYLSTRLKELGCEMQTMKPYKTVKRGEPPIRKQIEYAVNLDTSAQRTRSIIHALARAQEDRLRPMPHEQTVPAFSGFHANMAKPVEKSRAI